MSEVVLKGVSKDFGRVKVIKDVSLKIEDGQLTVFVGPSGCGKSTLLRMIAGLEEVTSGEVQIDGKCVNEVSPSRRGIGMVFQSYALYPHMTVYGNMAFGLQSLGLPKAEIKERIDQASEMLGLGPLLERKPKELSGGQRQRVAIGRTVVRQPKVFLLDEPLSNLDAALRGRTRVEIAKLRERLKATMIYVTHDQVEAMTLADKIVVLRAGVVEQVGKPMELYLRPRNKFVAGFIGSPSMNFVKAVVVEKKSESTTVRLLGGQLEEIPVAVGNVNPGEAVELGIRPENLVLLTQSDAGYANQIRGNLEAVERLGDHSLLYVKVTEAGESETLVAKASGDVELKENQTVALGFDSRFAHLFNSNGDAF